MQMAKASKDKVDCMTNLALVAQKERRFTDCFKWCDKALRWRQLSRRSPVTLIASLFCLQARSCGRTAGPCMCCIVRYLCSVRPYRSFGSC